MALTAELTTLDAELDRLTARAAPALRELCGVGAEVAEALLVTAGDDPARLRWHEPTRKYMARRTTQGLSKKEIIRCLKRYVAREVFAALMKTSPNGLAQAP